MRYTTAAVWNIFAPQGATWDLPLRWRDKDGNVLAVEPTYWTATIYVQRQDGTPIVEVEATIDGQHWMNFHLSAAETAALPFGEFEFYFKLVYTGDEEPRDWRLMQGAFFTDRGETDD